MPRAGNGLLMALALILLFIVSATPLISGEAPAISDSPAVQADLEMGADRPALSVGEDLTITLHARWPSSWQVEQLPAISEAFAELWLRQLGAVNRWQEGEWAHQRWSLTVVAERSGVWTLPQPVMYLRDQAGQRHELRANDLTVAVDLGEPPEIPEGPSWWRSQAVAEPSLSPWWWTLLLLPVALLGAALWWWRRRLQPVTSPEQRFAADCAALAQLSDGKQAAQCLSAALRRYLGTVVGFDGPAATTADCARLLDGRLPTAERQPAVQILRDLDALRWGPGPCQVTAIQALRQRAEALVEAHRQRVEAARAAAQQGDPALTKQGGGK